MPARNSERKIEHEAHAIDLIKTREETREEQLRMFAQHAASETAASKAAGPDSCAALGSCPSGSSERQGFVTIRFVQQVPGLLDEAFSAPCVYREAHRQQVCRRAIVFSLYVAAELQGCNPNDPSSSSHTVPALDLALLRTLTLSVSERRRGRPAALPH
jgi:hypothetical protein